MNYIVINHVRLYLKSTALGGKVEPFDGISEQCEDCASDIAETGKVKIDGLNKKVDCSCGCTYLIVTD